MNIIRLPIYDHKKNFQGHFIFSKITWEDLKSQIDKVSSNELIDNDDYINYLLYYGYNLLEQDRKFIGKHPFRIPITKWFLSTVSENMKKFELRVGEDGLIGKIKEEVKVEKVKLPKEVCEAIETMRSNEMTNYAIISSLNDSFWVKDKGCELSNVINANHVLYDYTHQSPLQNTELIIEALVNGYEVEPTPEKKLLEMYKQALQNHQNAKIDEEIIYYSGYSQGILITLETLGIEIEGINE